MIGRIVGGVLAASLLLPAAPAGAAPAGDDPAGAIELELLDQRFALEPDQPWQATFAMVGDLDQLELATTTTTPATTVTSSSAAPPGSTSIPTTTTGTPETETAARPNAAAPASPRAELRVVVHLPIDDRAELAAFLDGDDRNEISAVSSPLEPSVTRTGGATELRVDVPTTTARSGAQALQLRRAGLYPVTVQVVADDDVVAEHRTFVERRPVEPSDAEPINIAVLATLPDPPPGSTDALTDEQRADVEALAELSTSYAGPLTVAVPPAALLGVEAEAPALAERLRDALADDDELVSLPSAAFDPSSAAAVGETENGLFGRRLLDGEEALDAAVPTAPAERSAWITTAAVSDGAATMLRTLGFDLLILDDATYTGLDGNIGGFLDTTLTVDVELSGGGTMPALVLSPLGRLLDPEGSSSGGPVDAAVRILAELVTTRRELGEGQRRSVVLAAPGGRLPDAEVARALSELTGPLDDVRLVPLSTLAATTEPMLVDGEPSTVELPTTAGPDLSARLDRIELTRLSTESAASMQVGDDDARRWRSELDALINTALSDDDADAVLGRIAAEAETIRASIEAPAPFDFTLTGRSSTLRLNVRNTADEPLLVIVRARSPKLTFPGGDQLVELAPLGATEVTIPVEARSNGTSSIDVDLLTPQYEQPVNGSVLLTAHANALTGLGQVITVGALLVLGSWWFSHHRRQRRERLVGAAGTPGGAPLDVMSPDAAEVTVGTGVSGDDRAPDGEPAADTVRRP
ncbi:MAG: hypothetical protein ACR2HP_09180 [Ilumatobacteraceae bacterium]